MWRKTERVNDTSDGGQTQFTRGSVALRARSGTHAPLRTSNLPLPHCLRITFIRFFLKKQKRKKKHTHFFPPCVGGGRGLLSSTMRVTNSSYFQGSTFLPPPPSSPHTPDSDRWASLLLSLRLSVFPSVTTHGNIVARVSHSEKKKTRSWAKSARAHLTA